MKMKEETDAAETLNPTTNTKTLKAFLGAIQNFAINISDPIESTGNKRPVMKKGTKEIKRKNGTTTSTK